MEGISGKVVAITGASSGIGEATALRLAKQGALLILGARRVDRLQRLVETIRNEGGQAICCSLDVAKRDSVLDFVNLAIAEFGRLDVMVNNAGIMPLSFIAERKVEEWVSTIDVNFKGVLYGIDAALAQFLKQKSGHIINVTSVADRAIVPSASIYAGTKHAVRAVTEGLRKEMSDYGIQVTLVAPGAVATELFEGISGEELKAEMSRQAEGALSPDRIAGAIEFAIKQPADVDISELVIRPIPSII
jgi:NADP-dependent 3-hydroxy acid dehydrogenase YdfG